MKKHLDISYEDERGTIRDIFISNPKDHCSIITFEAGAVRGNHYHKFSTQYTYVILGELLMVTQRVDEQGNMLGELNREQLLPGDLVTHPPFHAHAFRAFRETLILAFADGVRGGVGYENDVYRLEIPIV